MRRLFAVLTLCVAVLATSMTAVGLADASAATSADVASRTPACGWTMANQAAAMDALASWAQRDVALGRRELGMTSAWTTYLAAYAWSFFNGRSDGSSLQAALPAFVRGSC